MNSLPYSPSRDMRLRISLKGRDFTLYLVVAFLAVVGLAATEKLSAQAVNFNTAGDLANNFNINGSTGNFAEVTSGGITGGAVDVLTNNASDTAIYKTAVPSGAGQTVSTSIFFRYDRALRDYSQDRIPVRLGFATSTTVSTSPADPYVGLDAGAHIMAVGGSSYMSIVCSAGSSSQAVEVFTNLLTGHWYQFTLDLTVTGNGDNALNFKTFLQDYGTDGFTPAAKRFVAISTLNSSNVTEATQLYAGFYAQKDGGADLLDNFSVMNGATPPKGADLALVLATNKDPVPVGRYVAYIATVTNNGPEEADINFSADLPAGEAYESVSCDQACGSAVSGNSISVSFDDIAVGASHQVYITAHVLSEGSLTVNSSVWSSFVEDDAPQNNMASYTTTAIPQPAAPAFSAAVNPATIHLGQITTASASLSGTNPTGEIWFQAFGPYDTGCNTNAEFTSIITVSGNGAYTSAPFAPSSTGTYRFITSYYGDDYNGDVIGQCGEPGETVTVTAAPTPTPTPTATPSPSPSPSPSPTAAPPKFGNISTRLNIGTGDNVLIGGFIINGPGGSLKKVMLRGIAPSLNVNGVPIPGRLSDPSLELHKPDGTIVANDNWAEAANAGEIPVDFRPTDSREAVIVATLPPGGYTVIMKGARGETGVGLVEAYDLDQPSPVQLANISTRGSVETGDNVMIGGFIVTSSTGSPKKVMLRGIGPSLNVNGVPVAGRITDPLLELHKPDGSTVNNDNWKDGANLAEIPSGFQPSDDRESLIIATLPPGGYTVIMRGAHGETGVGLVEAYQLDD